MSHSNARYVNEATFRLNEGNQSGYSRPAAGFMSGIIRPVNVSEAGSWINIAQLHTNREAALLKKPNPDAVSEDYEPTQEELDEMFRLSSERMLNSGSVTSLRNPELQHWGSAFVNPNSLKTGHIRYSTVEIAITSIYKHIHLSERFGCQNA